MKTETPETDAACLPWVACKVAAMFAGRKGHGGGRCCSRVLDADQLRDLLNEAFQAGIKSQETMSEKKEEVRILRLTLKKKWFDMIASGEKKEEYRTPGKWINSRIHGKKYDVIEFKNGYGANVPAMIVEYKGATHGMGKPEWGGSGEHVLVIHLGAVLSVR